MVASPSLAPVRDWVFRAAQQRHLIYNACWEDPAQDRVALSLGPDDRILVITSGGCNALDYLLAGAGAVEAVDSNPCQSALLAFKVAAIRGLNHSDFWELFGEGRSRRARQLYFEAVRPRLDFTVRRYWDRHWHYFAGQGWRRSFYYHGGWGLMMRLIVGYWKDVRGLREPLEALFRAGNLDAQRYLYETQLRNRLWTRGLSWFSSRRLPLVLMGIPERQREGMLAYPGGILGRGRTIVEELASTIPFASNYFYRAYLLGSYASGCCPEYLTPEGFARLRSGLLDRLTIHTSTLTTHLKRGGPAFSRFVLLDHMDWLGTGELADEWQEILRRAAPGARVLFRSALLEVRYLESLLVSHRGVSTPLGSLLRYDRALASALHARDRVHMYGSFHIATLPGAEA